MEYIIKGFMKKQLVSVTFLLIVTLSACNPVPLPPTEIPLAFVAQNTMIQYFADLNNAEYEHAALSYGGSYEILQAYNPDIDPSEHASLLRTGCERNGLQCMQIMSIEKTTQVDSLTYQYHVSFRSADGGQFVLGPCCGATKTEMPPVRYFDITVSCTDEAVCRVMELPPYVP